MGYSTLKIDYEELTDVKAGLDFVSSELTNAKYISDQLKTMVGNPEPDLKGAIGTFESSWDANRATLVGIANELAEAVQRILDDWMEWDQNTAAEFQGTGESTSNNTNGPV